MYDYGPPGSSLQANIIAEWRKHFIIEEHMLELDTTIMTPAPVFETSGHVARFADWMVKDSKTGDVLRADHLVKNVLEARLAGDKGARGLATQPLQDDKKKKKKAAKVVAVQLPDEVVKEYETILARVCTSLRQGLDSMFRPWLCSSTTILDRSLENYVEITKSPIPIQTMKSLSLNSSTSCSQVASVPPVNIQGGSRPTHRLTFLCSITFSQLSSTRNRPRSFP